MKKFRSFRNKKKHLSSKYILLILTGVCIVALFTSLVFNLSGGPLNSVAGYVFVPMQRESTMPVPGFQEKQMTFKHLEKF